MTVNKGPPILGKANVTPALDSKAMATAGCVRVELFPTLLPTGELCVQKVRTYSTLGLRHLVPQSFVGLPLVDAEGDACETLLRTLYAVCPEAHVAAWRLASSALLGREMPVTERVKLNRRVALEAAWGHLRLFALDMPSALGLSRAVTMDNLRRIQGKGGWTTVDQEGMVAAVEALITGVALEYSPSVWTRDALYAWAQTGVSGCAQMFQALFEAFALGMSATQQSSNEPVVRLVEHLKERLNDLLEIARALKQGAMLRSRLHIEMHANAATVQVDTARGTLQWRLTVAVMQEGDDGALRSTVKQLEICAPTERNFAPGELAERLLESLKAPDEATLRYRASGIVTALDPCTESVIEIHSVEDAYA